MELTPDVVRWHDLECGLYRADLPLWLKLAGPAPTLRPILDLGAGTGRVSLALAGAGHDVIALDRDADLLAALADRTDGLPVRTVNQDARRLELAERDLALAIAPMQTIQLLGGVAGRGELMSGVRRHMRAGGILACAIVTDAEEFDCGAGDLGPGPEVARTQDAIFVSRAVSVRVSDSVIRIERVRRVLSADGSEPASVLRTEPDVIELDRVTAPELAHEARAAGFEAESVQVTAATEEHVASEVVILRAG